MSRSDDHDCALPDLVEALRQNFGDDAVPGLLDALWDDVDDDSTEETR
ncbi:MULTISPECIES: hypothetical protein [unclassified Microbispora]|nr:MULTISPECIES: hypothetical protein [unclassified Microbispora]NJP24498.1 hypothetical protein [Microbispora sp. CL1-1]